MGWIESHTVLSRHRKLKEFARSLRIKPVYAMGHLHALWHDALEQQEDGNLERWSDSLIAESSQFDGDAPQYVSLLQEHGWLDKRLIHDWLEYAGAYLRGKYAKDKREKLVEIWAIHGKRYGLPTGSQQDPNILSLAPNLTIPTKPNLPNLTKQKKEELVLPEDLKEDNESIKTWLAYKREKGQGYKPRGLNALWGILRVIPQFQRKAAIETSMANNWAGIFPPKGGNNGKSSVETNRYPAYQTTKKSII